MEILKWVLISYGVLASIAFVISALIAHGQGEQHWFIESAKVAIVFPYWLYKIIF